MYIYIHLYICIRHAGTDLGRANGRDLLSGLALLGSLGGACAQLLRRCVELPLLCLYGGGGSGLGPKI